MTLLSIENLSITFEGAPAPAVTSVSIEVEPGARVGIIGESGSGKSVTAMSVLRLNDESIMVYGDASRVMFDGKDLLRADDRALREIRGRRISMIFQDPMSVLNPVFTVGAQIVDVLRAHSSTTRKAARSAVVRSLAEVGIRDPDRVFDQYPHELSGGMRQRVMIAMAIASRPRLLIADEATSALDVTVQAAVLGTLDRLAVERDMAVLMITHDMGVVARFCDVVYVMYRGDVVEHGPVSQILLAPQHEYTRRLLTAVPRLRG
ncbi:ABC transporter ATP-binding protein [Microbacterium tenebrionis]|uniref:ABC transporter ATP-binding protein n=1 Tax=Microbacterium tenebrionis TaxID=2830665 RepID=UPI00158926D3|nr:ABC transporter ATP-binding protein [Microbacterium ihumii]